MSDIPDGFEEVIPDGFEEVSTPKKKRGLLDYAKGAGEAALQVASSIPAGVYAPVAGMATALRGDRKFGTPEFANEFDRLAGESMQFNTYEPRTEVGKEMADGVGEFMNRYGIPGGAVFHTMPPVRTAPSVRGMVNEAKSNAALTEKITKNSPIEAIPEGFEEVKQPAQQLELPLENNPQQISEMQNRATGQRDLFAPVNESGFEGGVRPVTPDSIPRPLDVAGQGDLPFKTSVEEIAQNRMDPNQPDLFGQGAGDLSRPEVPNQLSEFGNRERTGYRGNGVEINPDLPQSIKQVTKPSIETAVDKISTGRNFDLTSEERIAWDKAKGMIEKVDPTFRNLSEKDIAAKVMDREWVQQTVERGRQMDQMYREVEQRSMDRQAVADATRKREALSDTLDELEQHLRDTAYKPDLEGQGPVTRQANRDLWNQKSLNSGMKRGQGGGIDFQSIADFLSSIKESIKSLTMGRERPVRAPVRTDNAATPRSPENIAYRQSQMAKINATVRNNPVLAERFKEFDGPATVEETKYMLEQPDVKDITGSVTGGHIRERFESGLRSKAAKTGNPMLAFANRVFSDARAQAGQFVRDYLTSKEGFATVGQKLKSKELVEAIQILNDGDKHQRFVTRAEMEAKGFSEDQMRFVEAHYKADAALLEAENKARRALGMAEIKERAGHVPGIFNGNYKTLVLNSKGKPIAVIATDTAWSHEAAKAKIKELHPDATFQTKERFFTNTYGKRTALGGNYVRSDLFSGMNDVMQMLAENDPKFAEIQKVINDTINNSSNAIYGFNKHELAKKGITGNEGNKPWLSPEKNAQQQFKSMLQYFEEGSQHFNLLEPMNDVSNLVKDYSDKFPNATKFLSDYNNHVLGHSTEPMGQAINIAIDTPFKLLGIGSKVPFKIARDVKNLMAQKFMGFLNGGFTVAQLLQTVQSGAPFAELVRAKAGLSHTEMVTAAGEGTNAFMGAFLEQLTGKDLGVSEFGREAFKYMNDRGLTSFSEMERANEATKGKFRRGFDSIADVNMKIGEAGSRGPVFMAIAHILKHAGAETAQALRIAENVTQTAMIDYHPWERPRMYANMGVMGQFAGGLTTFKHGYVNQQIILGKEARKGNVTPILASGAAMVALAGISGIPFYSEADSLYQKLTSAMGEQKTIRESLLNPLLGDNESLKTGLLSTVTGLNWQSKFAGDMLPQDIPSAMSPHLNAAAKILGDAFDALHHGDAQSLRNLANDASPGGWIKGNVESMTSRAPDGTMIDRNGDLGYPRTEEDWSARKTWGMSTQKEALNRQFEYELHNKEGGITKQHLAISGEITRAVKNGLSDQDIVDRYWDSYEKTGGSDQTFLHMIEQAKQASLKTQEERDIGSKFSKKAAQEKVLRYLDKEKVN